MKAERKIDYPSALIGFQRSNFALVANSSTYDLVDLQNNQKIPLFEISAGEQNDSFQDEEESEEIAKKQTEDDKSHVKNKDTDSNDQQKDTPQTTDSKSSDSDSPTEDQTTDKEPKEETEQENDVKKTSTESSGPKPIKKLKPMICAVSNDEFIVTSGTKYDEPAMGLVVNTDGDISRGTIAWPKYPESIAVDYPYVASVIDNQVQLYSLHDQVLVQSIDYKSTPTVYNVSAPISQSYLPLTDKIRLVPLKFVSIKPDTLSEEQTKRIEKEKEYAEKLSIISSSLFVYSKEEGIQCLLSSPRIIHLERLAEQGRVDEVKEEINTVEVTSEKAFVEIEYLGLLVGLGYLLHGDFENATSFWLEGTLDPRVVIYTFDNESVKGDMWIFNGLIKFVKQILEKISSFRSDISTQSDITTTPKVTSSPSKKSKKGAKNKKNIPKSESTQPSSSSSSSSIDKTKNLEILKEANQYYSYFLSEWLKRRDLESVVDKPDVFNSIEIAYLKHLLSEFGPLTKSKFYNFLNNEVIESVEEAIEILSTHKKYYGQFILYQKYNYEEKACAIWKKILNGEIQDPDFDKNEEDFTEYLLHTSTDHDIIWNYGMWLVERAPDIALAIFSHRPAESPIHFEDTDILNALKKLKNQRAWKSFLKILVYERHDLSLQADLIELTVDDLLDKIRISSEIRAGLSRTYKEYKQLPLPKRGYLDFIQSRMKRGLDTEITKMRLDLLKLLLFDGNYNVNLIREKLESSGGETLLVVELCVIYSRLNMHKRCLNILIHILLDFDISIEYCLYGRLVIRSLMDTSEQTPNNLEQNNNNKSNTSNKTGSNNNNNNKKSNRRKNHQQQSQIQTKEASSSHATQDIIKFPKADKATQHELFTKLFDEILSLTHESTRSLYTRMLLEKYGDQLDTFQVLAKAPSDWPLEVMSGYLYKTLRKVMSEKTESTIQKSLARAEHSYISNHYRALKRAQTKALENNDKDK